MATLPCYMTRVCRMAYGRSRLLNRQVALVRVNNVTVLRSDNEFRRWRVPIGAAVREYSPYSTGPHCSSAQEGPAVQYRRPLSLSDPPVSTPDPVCDSGSHRDV
jgi:hypothetical protein